ncbi:hypothetical protein NP233_g12544 [Leucocoprinus birnbaumii]|uniref:NACHT domain-containing protein n=1 Tax=Leucocoprinus birnbaumii TaxID=56174 RepID=A0AAD5VGT0_9AGAR|nr:hypothetical protein NP233_g12544 [Leucocoprinus birnbaumii]
MGRAMVIMYQGEDDTHIISAFHSSDRKKKIGLQAPCYRQRQLLPCHHWTCVRHQHLRLLRPEVYLRAEETICTEGSVVDPRAGPSESTGLAIAASSTQEQLEIDDDSLAALNPRNSIFTIGSIATTLPRYSLVEFTNLDSGVAQVDQWNPESRRTYVLGTTSQSDESSPIPRDEPSDPPGYTADARPSTPPVQEVPGPSQSGRSSSAQQIGFGKPSAREPWATLNLISRPPLPGTRKRTPRFIGGDPIRGSVDLRLDAPMNVHSIKLAFAKPGMPAPLNAQALHRPIRPGGAFSNAHDFAIYNPFFFNQSPSADYFMEKFAVYTIQGAELDSSDRYPPPRCHPCTRKSIIERMQLWLNNPWRIKRMLWLVGPAGVGKSAIMQTVAENECQSNILAALFFSAPNGRNDPRKVITSLAYQLAAKYPPYLNYVRAAIMANPKILEKSIVGQFAEFIVRPFIQQQIFRDSAPVLIFIDGLDECNGQDEQILLLSLVFYFTTRFPDAPILWVISSRPEVHITRHLARGRLSSCFDKEEVSIDSTEACQDVELFVRTELRNIRASDPVMSLYLDWPSEWLLLKFLAAAQGFFAYAHTAIRFIKEGSPITRFQLVVDLIDNPFPETSSSTQPMAQLDILYRHILSQITPEDLPHASDILFFLLFPPKGEWWGPDAQSLMCDWLGMTPYIMHNALRQLHSVLDVPLPHMTDEPIGVYHKSFTDFLLRMPQPLLNLPTSEPDARRVHYLKCLRIMNRIPITQLPTADRIPAEILFWPHQDLDKRAEAQDNLAEQLRYVYREAVAQSPDLTSHSILHDMKVLADLDDEPPCKIFVEPDSEIAKRFEKDGSLRYIPIRLLDLRLTEQTKIFLFWHDGYADNTEIEDNDLLYIRYVQLHLPEKLVKVFIGNRLRGWVDGTSLLPSSLNIHSVESGSSHWEDVKEWFFYYDFSTIYSILQE